MPKSRNRPAHKKKKQVANLNKLKQKSMQKELKNKVENMPVSYTYHRDAQSVVIPLRAWQMLNALAKELQPLAMLVSTFEQLGQDHINDGTLIPVFQADVEPEMKDGAPVIVQGQIQYKVKDNFWAKHPIGAGAADYTPEVESGLVGPDGNTPIEEAVKQSAVESL